ncbi:disease resistance protein RGA2-like [Phragmites australis]|uniref:disease resistance protein RGA2-like n=1 Tax=Phragmites australis TaxID=29695 RepID=UPI002D7923A4|nr:disease resistance protein RGA2-like [Phragmites australis]
MLSTNTEGVVFAMEMLSNAVMSELVSRSLSFLFAKCEKQTTATVQEDLQRLHNLLLRSGTIVEEAERRLVTNRAMLQQLQALRDETFRGNYVLDAVRCRAALGGGDRRKDDDDEEEVSHRKFALSRFNPAKRVRFPSGGSETTAAFCGASSRELQQVVRSLEVMIGDTKELVVFLMNYPPLYRQPYSAHLFMDKCMFGRHMERERVIEFLLQIEPPGAAKLGVLPIVGPAHIGKSTLVEHVCDDERVRNHFSMILFYSRNDLKDETMANLRDNCVIKHQNDRASGERLLIVIELLEDVDEDAWKRLYSSERSMPQGSRMIIASRPENIARLGTTQALRLKCLPTEAYWYFFKTHVFGSDDPG